MKLIFISGPSGSGKTTLSNQIIKKNNHGIVLSTDNYYKTGLISKLLSKFVEGFFDRSISFNNKLFKKDFDFIYKNRISIRDRYSNFEKKTYLIFMQAYEPLHGILNYFKKHKKDKMYIQNLKLFIISKVKILLKNRS